jgi:hypothetical protein
MIVGGLALTGLFGFIWGNQRLEPYIVGLTETAEIKIGLYPSTSDTIDYQMYTGNVRKFEIIIKGFSKELQLATLSGKPIEEAPFNLPPITWDREAQFAVWGFKVATPPSIQPGEYGINLVLRVSNWFSSREYLLKIVVIVEPQPQK